MSRPPVDRVDATAVNHSLRGIVQAFDRLHRIGAIRSRSGVDLERSLHPIVVLLGERGRMRTSELADALALQSSTISRHVARLVDAGLVERAEDSADGRASVLSLSPEGRTTCDALVDTWIGIFLDALETLDAEAPSFSASLARFSEHLATLDP